MADLFKDGFEDGTTDAWTVGSTDGGKLSVATGARLHGNYGLSLLIDDTDSKWIWDGTPNAESRYRFRFYIDLNSLTIDPGKSLQLLQLYDNAWANQELAIRIENDSPYWLVVNDRTDGAWTAAIGYNVSDAPHCIEVDWKAATGVGQNDGFIKLYLDGVLVASDLTVDNDTEAVGNVNFGAMAVNTDISGTFYLDDFASNDDGSFIGQIGENAIMFGCNF